MSSTPEEHIERAVARDLDGLPLVVAGKTGHPGERGPKGDHGQPGHEGQRGFSGPPGRGASRTQVLAGFIFVTICFLLLAYRTEANTRALKDNSLLQQNAAYVLCIESNENIVQLNQLYKSLSQVESDNPFSETSPSTIARRVEVYKAAKLATINCGPKP